MCNEEKKNIIFNVMLFMFLYIFKLLEKLLGKNFCFLLLEILET